MSDLASALAKLQADLPRIKRTGRGQVGTRRYSYPPYEQILAVTRPILHKHGFLWHTAPTLCALNDELRFVLQYTLEHLPTGEALSGWYPLREATDQQQGAAISYAKRYALVAVLDLEIEGEDTDAVDTPTRRPQRSQTTGAEHERLREGLHTATPDQRPADRGPLPDEDNPWQGPPPEGERETRAGTIDPVHRTRIMILCKDMTRGDRLKKISALAGRTVDSANQLSYVEGIMVVERLEAEA